MWTMRCVQIVDCKLRMNFKIRDLVLAVFSAFLGSVKGLLVSHVKSLGAIEIFGLRSIGAVCFMLPLIVYGNLKLWYDFRCNLILSLRSVIGNVAVTGYYFGFVNLPIAEASLLFYSSPIFTVILGHFFLDEKCGFNEAFSIFLSLSGVALVCWPHFSFSAANYADKFTIGIIGCITGAVAQAVALVIIRKITYVPPVVVSFWWAVVGVLFSGVLSFVSPFSVWTCGLESVFIVLIALVGFVCELCLVAALKSTNAVIVSIALTFEIACAFFFQVYINNEGVTSMTMLGGVAIVLSVVLPPLFTYACAKKQKLDLKKSCKDIENFS